MPTSNGRGQFLLHAGFWGGPLFVVSLLAFGALTPGFSQRHKAVSELGALGSPWGLWFDLFGMFIPGLLAAGAAFELRRRLRVIKADTRWATGLVVYGVMIALTAVPADFSRMFRSPWTWVHAFFVLGNAFVFFVVSPGCAKGLRTLGASPAATRIFLVLTYLVGAEFFLYGVLPHAPGLVQRAMILTAHGAIAWMSGVLLRISRSAPTTLSV